MVALQDHSEPFVSKRPGGFNRFDVFTQSWYPVMPSRRLSAGTAMSLEFLGRKVAFYRSTSRTVHALDARCPHLGADLGRGKVFGENLQCTFHGWQFGTDGHCVHAPNLTTPKRFTRSYPTLERWGYVWLYNGSAPLFALPQADKAQNYVVVRLPSQHIKCHPHLVIGNGLDVGHFEALHGFEVTEVPRLKQLDGYTLRLELRGKPVSKVLQTLTGTTRQAIEASFTTIGGNLAWVELTTPLHFYLLFTGKPSANGCDTKTFAFVPKNNFHRLPQMASLVYAILQHDRRILDGLEFHTGFTENDTVLKTFVDVVNTLPIG